VKICSFTEWEMQQLGHERARKNSRANGICVMPTPAESAVRILLGALDTVNQAGLDGKKLSDITLKVEPRIDRNDVIYEIHAKVTHRLKTEEPKP